MSYPARAEGLVNMIMRVLSKDVSSTIFWDFGMTRPGIEPRSPGLLANTLPTRTKGAIIVDLLSDLLILMVFQPVQIYLITGTSGIRFIVHLYIYIYCHPQTDCFVISELFSVARHVRRSKPGSKPIQLYIRLSLRPLGQQAYHVG